jgi:hypothetical protein
LLLAGCLIFAVLIGMSAFVTPTARAAFQPGIVTEIAGTDNEIRKKGFKDSAKNLHIAPKSIAVIDEHNLIVLSDYVVGRRMGFDLLAGKPVQAHWDDFYRLPRLVHVYFNPAKRIWEHRIIATAVDSDVKLEANGIPNLNDPVALLRESDRSLLIATEHGINRMKFELEGTRVKVDSYTAILDEDAAERLEIPLGLASYALHPNDGRIVIALPGAIVAIPADKAERQTLDRVDFIVAPPASSSASTSDADEADTAAEALVELRNHRSEESSRDSDSAGHRSFRSQATSVGSDEDNPDEGSTITEPGSFEETDDDDLNVIAPVGVAVDEDGTTYFCDVRRQTVEKVDAFGQQSTVVNKDDWKIDDFVPRSLTVHGGELFVGGYIQIRAASARVFAVDLSNTKVRPLTGQRSLIGSAADGTDPERLLIDAAYQIVFLPDSGNMVIADRGVGLGRIHLLTQKSDKPKEKLPVQSRKSSGEENRPAAETSVDDLMKEFAELDAKKAARKRESRPSGASKTTASVAKSKGKSKKSRPTSLVEAQRRATLQLRPANSTVKTRPAEEKPKKKRKQKGGSPKVAAPAPARSFKPRTPEPVAVEAKSKDSWEAPIDSDSESAEEKTPTLFEGFSHKERYLVREAPLSVNGKTTVIHEWLTGLGKRFEKCENTDGSFLQSIRIHDGKHEYEVDKEIIDYIFNDDTNVRRFKSEGTRFALTVDESKALTKWFIKYILTDGDEARWSVRNGDDNSIAIEIEDLRPLLLRNWKYLDPKLREALVRTKGRIGIDNEANFRYGLKLAIFKDRDRGHCGVKAVYPQGLASPATLQFAPPELKKAGKAGAEARSLLRRIKESTIAKQISRFREWKIDATEFVPNKSGTPNSNNE